MHQKRRRPETMPAHTQTRRVVDKHTDKQMSACRPTTQRWVFGPPEFSCLPVADSPYRIASTVHQTWGRERNFLSPTIGCLPARPLASALRRLVPPLWEVFPWTRLPPSASAGLSLTPAGPPLMGGFLLRQIPTFFPAGPQIYTGLSCSA